MQGKLLPQATDLEVALLGAIMLEADGYDTAALYLREECFYTEQHQYIFRAMSELALDHSPIDMLTVKQQLDKNGRLEQIGGAYAIAKLTDAVISGTHIEAWARIIFEKYQARKNIEIATDIISKSFDDEYDSFEVNRSAISAFGSVGEFLSGDMVPARKVINDVIDKVEYWRQHANDGVTGIDTGSASMNSITHGWQPGNLIIIAARPATGKCLGKGTKIIMYDGTLKKVEDIKVGDLLMGDDSTSRKVLSLARGREMMYNVKQVRGIQYRVNESHILSLMRSRNSYSKKHGEIIDMPIKEYLSHSKKFQNNWKGYKVSIDFPRKDVLIPPYLLGLWLGDGSTNKAEITNPDLEIREYIYQYAKENDMRVRKSPDTSKRCVSFSIVAKEPNKGFPSFVGKLRQMSVLKRKHIPTDYLYNSRDSRLQLLAGLIDTNGYLEPGGVFEITQKNKDLSYQIKFLADSLGFRTNIRIKRATIKSIGFTGNYYRLTISGDIHNIPNKVERKKWRKQTRQRDHKISGLRITKDKIDDYYGFVIDGNHRFLLEDCTVTHNTAYALNIAKSAAKNGSHVAVWSLEMSNIFLALRMVSEDSGIFMNKIQSGRMNENDMNELVKSGNRIADLNLWFDEDPNVTISSISRKARKLKKRGQLDEMIVDYIQLMTPEAKSNAKIRERQVAELSRNFKLLAKELGIPIIALSQIGRESGAKNVTWEVGPPLHSLRESGALEQDADLVIALWKPDPSEITADNGLEDKVKVKVIKHRNGTTGLVLYRFRGEIQKFEALGIMKSDGSLITEDELSGNVNNENVF